MTQAVLTQYFSLWRQILIFQDDWSQNFHSYVYFVCLYVVILDTNNCFPHLTASGSASTAFLVLWQTNGRCHSKLGFKEQGQVHPESDCIQAWVSCEITLYKSLIQLPQEEFVWRIKYYTSQVINTRNHVPRRRAVICSGLIGFVGFNGREAQLLNFTGFVERQRCTVNFLWWYCTDISRGLMLNP